MQESPAPQTKTKTKVVTRVGVALFVLGLIAIMAVGAARGRRGGEGRSSVRLPDLKVSATAECITLPYDGVDTTAISFTGTVEVGGASTSRGFTLDSFWVRPDGISGLLESDDRVESLAMGASWSANHLLLPTTVVEQGLSSIRFVADHLEQITESNETNNTITIPIPTCP